uniref:Uncharacterized protein n=1 Tax=Rhizophora mucronata TaxID=61149 RepID=A0A2P2L3T9_RHIMU
MLQLLDMHRVIPLMVLRGLMALMLVLADEMTEVDTLTPCMEEQLRHLKIITTKDDNAFSSTLDSATLMGINLEAYITQKKMRAAVLSMGPSNVYKLLEVLVARWQSRSHSGNYVLPWIYSILVNYGHSIMAHEKPETQMLSSLLKVKYCVMS